MKGINEKYCWFLAFNGRGNQNGFMSFIDYDDNLNEAMLLFTTKDKAERHLIETDSVDECTIKRITWEKALEIANQEELDLLMDNTHRAVMVWVDKEERLSLFNRN